MNENLKHLIKRAAWKAAKLPLIGPVISLATLAVGWTIGKGSWDVVDVFILDMFEEDIIECNVKGD